jgi:tetratricopeptide (TPR) repeat protein
MLFIACILSSCRSDRQSDDYLEHAESLLDQHPDSALIFLNKIAPKDLSTGEYARYCLLMTQARDKNGLPLTSDSLISVAVEYFNDKKDLDTKAKTYFYAGRVNQDMQNAKQAMEYFLKAADFSEDSKDYKLRYLIYYYLGDLYFNENLYESALKSNRQAFYYSQLLNNKSYMVYVLRSIALAYSGKRDYHNALKYYFNALNILPKSDIGTLSTILNEIGVQYNHLKDYSHALEAVNKAISINQDSAKLLYNYFVKAEIYFNVHQFDSAVYYYDKTTCSSDLYTKTESYNKLSKVERNRGDINKALFYNDDYITFRDSTEKQLHADMIIKMQNIYQHKKSVEKIQYLTLEKNQQKMVLYLISAISLGILSLLASILLLYRSRKERQTRELELVVQKEKEESQIAKARLQESELVRIRKEKELLEKEMELRTDFFSRLNNITFPFLSIQEGKEGYIRLTQEDWDAIVKNTDAAFDHFSVRLAKAFPELKRDEILFCCLIKMKLGLNTLSSVYNLTKDAISKRKERIKKNKMRIEDGRSLDQFLADF